MGTNNALLIARTILVSSLFMLGLLLPRAQADVWYVDRDNESGVEDGASWDTAYTTIQPAIDAAHSAGGGEVWVAEGTYFGACTLRSNVAAYGGFAGIETALAQRDIASHKAIINADASEEKGPPYNAVIIFEVANTRLDGFTITGSIAYPDYHLGDYGDVERPGYNPGGGIFCMNADGTNVIERCHVTKNTGLRGGGLFCKYTSAQFVGCSFTANDISSSGVCGGVYCAGAPGPAFIDCGVSKNTKIGMYCTDGSTASFVGGYIYGHRPSGFVSPYLLEGSVSRRGDGVGLLVVGDSSVQVAGCTIQDNEAADGAGVIVKSAALHMSGCTIQYNKALDCGGGIGVGDGGKLKIEGCTLLGNRAVHGGGFFVNDYGSAEMRSCEILKNEATEEGGGGYCQLYDDIADCVFKENQARRGGGLHGFKVDRCTFISNGATYGGGAMHYDRVFRGVHSLTAQGPTNCLFVGNQASSSVVWDIRLACYLDELKDYGPVEFLSSLNTFWANAETGHFLPDLLGGTDPTISSCIFWNNKCGDILNGGEITHSVVQGGWPGEGNTDSDPLFVDAENGVFYLDVMSPAIDTGLITDGDCRDRSGRYRPLSWGVDMGAFEFQGTDADTLHSFLLPLTPPATTAVVELPWIAWGGDGTTAYVELFYRRNGGEWLLCPDAYTDSPIEFDTSTVGGDGYYEFRTIATDMGGTAETPSSICPVRGLPVISGFEGARVYVDGTAEGFQTAESWENAIHSITAALAVADAHGIGEIWVAAGEYPESIELISDLALCGGFAGTEDYLDERKVCPSATVIDASQVGYGDPALHVVVMKDVVNTRLDGFTLTGAVGSDGDFFMGYGCCGGVVCVRADETNTVSDCVIAGNRAGSAAGVNCFCSSPQFRNCAIAGNEWDGIGVGPQSSPTFENCAVVGNTGTGVACERGSPTLVDCVLSENSGGGVVRLLGLPAKPLLVNCLVSRNSGAGGVSADATLVNCVIAGNTGRTYGGGLTWPKRVINCTIALNTAPQGGALRSSGAHQVLNTIIDSNSTYGVYAKGSVSDSDLMCCLFHANEDGDCHYFDVDTTYTGAEEIMLNVPTATGIVDGDPLFANPEVGDFSLLAGSAAIDAGTSPDAPDTDFLGEPRPEGYGVDIGAYEYTPGTERFEVVLDADGEGTIEPAEGVHACTAGARVVVLAEAEEGWQFSHWEGGLEGIVNPAVMTVDGNKTLTAVFREEYELTLTAGSHGTTAPSPGFYVYLDGDTIELAATASIGWGFDHWEGDLTGSNNPCDVVMDGPKAIAAVFVRYFSLTTEVCGDGEVHVSEEAESYPNGETLTLTAVPDALWLFDHWEGDVTGDAASVTIVMDGDKSATAVFTRLYTVSTSVEGQGLVYFGNGTGAYRDGSAATVLAVPAEGWIFDHWEGDAAGSDNPLALIMDGDKAITAVFTRLYTVSTAVEGQGLVYCADGIGVYPDGSTATVVAVPAEGWIFDHWEGGAAGGDNPLTLLVDGDKAVTAVFERRYTLSIQVEGQGQVDEASGPTFYRAGSEASLAAIPAEGWAFDHWEGDATGTDNPTMVLMDQDRSVVAVFKQLYTLTPHAVGRGHIEVGDEAGVYPDGATATLVAVPAEGWAFRRWRGDAEGTDNPLELVMDGAKTVWAVFVPHWDAPPGCAGGTSSSGCGPGVPPLGDVALLAVSIIALWMMPGVRKASRRRPA